MTGEWTKDDIASADAVRQLNITPRKILDVTEGEAEELTAWASRQGWAVDIRWATAEGRRVLAADEHAERAGSKPAGLPSAGRCDGIAGDAETTTGPPEAGRLDRILAEIASKPYLPDPQVWWLAPSAAERAVANVAEIERLRSMVVALECEGAALTDALAKTTHEYVRPPADLAAGYRHAAELQGGPAEPCWSCGISKDGPRHRTPARVRAELEGQ